LNPKKSHFSLKEGKLLDHIVSKEGVNIDPSRVEESKKIPLPRNKKEIQSFLGRINFLRIFVPNYAEITKGITDMLKEGVEVKWNSIAKESFSRFKVALQESPLLVIPDYKNPFQLFSFASASTIATLLLQRNEEGREQLVAFFSRVLRDVELKYNILEKEAYALVKALKAFRVYILQSQVTAYVPNATIKYVLFRVI